MPASRDDPPALQDTYFNRSRRPLQVLAFLLPLIVVYELGMLFVLRTAEGGTHTIVAHKRLIEAFDLFGLSALGWFLPGLLIVVVLLVWQFLSREPWRVSGRTLLMMAAESAALMMPLMVFGQMVARLAGAEPPAAAGAAAATTFAEHPLAARITLSVGAGLYEELVFRMAILGALHAVFVDLVRANERLGNAIAVTISAGLFAVYHFYPADVAASFSWPLATFYFAAGLFFGAVFLIRGFGIVVAVHALYDVVTGVIIEF